MDLWLAVGVVAVALDMTIARAALRRQGVALAVAPDALVVWSLEMALLALGWAASFWGSVAGGEAGWWLTLAGYVAVGLVVLWCAETMITTRLWYWGD